MNIIDWTVSVIEVCAGKVVEASYPCSMVNVDIKAGQLSINVDGIEKAFSTSLVSFNPIFEGQQNEQRC
ncbi:hypothetical protein ABK883_11935 [Enterobacter roggenkampii]|uniref:hypothetical protein n=1 Tax=Enterobacter roggenkampii TaxID=1812935 RepID=UPI00374EB2B3